MKKSKQNIYFITYGDAEYSISKKHLIGLAEYSDYFDECISFGPNDIDANYYNKFERILSEKRGGGYWLWKYYFINKLIKEINENDLIIYCDAGASFNYKAKKRLYEYIELINDSNFGNLRIECEPHFIEKEWTSSQIFNYFNIDENSNLANSVQLEGGHMIFKKTEHTSDYLHEFKKIMDFDQFLITDKYNKIDQKSYFIENRHDQSIFSVISKKFGCEFIKNETEFKERPHDQYDFPFLSVRKGGHGIKDKTKFYMTYFKKIKNPIYFEDID
jgi:hypothetical protein